MTIGHAVQRGTLIYIYDAKGEPVTSISAPGRWATDGLKGYTASRILVQKGELIYSYDCQGHPVDKPVATKQGNVTEMHWVTRRTVTCTAKPLGKFPQVYEALRAVG